jgi:hypothetical protein
MGTGVGNHPDGGGNRELDWQAVVGPSPGRLPTHNFIDLVDGNRPVEGVDEAMEKLRRLRP